MCIKAVRASVVCSTRAAPLLLRYFRLPWRAAPFLADGRYTLMGRRINTRWCWTAGCGGGEPRSAASVGGLQSGAGRGARSARAALPAARGDRRRDRRLPAPARGPARVPGGGQQVGLVVRALPPRVPLLPEGRSAGKRVAFLAVDSDDRAEGCGAHVPSSRYPVPYPSYFDPDAGDRALFRGELVSRQRRFLRPAGGTSSTTKQGRLRVRRPLADGRRRSYAATRLAGPACGAGGEIRHMRTRAICSSRGLAVCAARGLRHRPGAAAGRRASVIESVVARRHDQSRPRRNGSTKRSATRSTTRPTW